MRLFLFCIAILVIVSLAVGESADGENDESTGVVSVEKRQGRGNNRRRERNNRKKGKKLRGIEQGNDGKFTDTATEETFGRGFEKFKKNFKKDVSPSEELSRRNNFKNNAAKIKELIESKKGYKLDEESIFMFLSEEEKASLTGVSDLTQLEDELSAEEKTRPGPPTESKVVSKRKEREDRRKGGNSRRRRGVEWGEGGLGGDANNLTSSGWGHIPQRKKRQDSGLPEELDLRLMNMVTAVKNQLECGSCWAFSAVAVLEGAFALETGFLRSFSEQSVIDCNLSYGCEGGYWTKAWRQIRDAQYAALESDQAYQAVKGDVCDVGTTNGLTDVMNIGSWKVMREEDNESGMLGYLNTYGPVTVVLFADNRLYFYKSGVIPDCLGGQTGVNHAVTLVGYGTNHLVMKNSWGTAWGDNGYFSVARGCGIQGYSYWASFLSVVNIGGGEAPFTTEDQVLTIPLTESNGKLTTIISLNDGVLNDDIFHMEIPETLTSHSNFNVKLKAADGALVYFLYVYKTRSGRYCRERTMSSDRILEKNVRVRCPGLVTGVRHNVDIRVTSTGYSTRVGPNQLALYPHIRPFSSITTFFLAAGDPGMITAATRFRTVISTSSSGDPIIQTCYDYDSTCPEILSEGLGSCSTGDTAAWMQENCRKTCGLCPV